MRKALWLIWFIFLVIISVSAQNDTVFFSVRGGFYYEVLPLELYNIHPENHIRYTTNGNRPDAHSPLYADSLVLDERMYSHSDIYTIVDCPEQDFFLPDSVRHCIVIRAAVFDENDSCVSRVMTQSYFIRDLGCNTHGLPVVSLCADSLDLFGYETGIFVPGIHYDPLDPNWTGNYYEEGREWERPMNIEFYELENTGINQQAGLRTHGGNGRRFQQKSLKIYAREEYGKKRFKHKFFENIPQNSFKHLVLKPFAASWNQSGVNDHICNQIASQLDVESLASRPVALYLNGEYWGIYYIHEKPDERYLEDHFDVDIDYVNIIKGWNPLLDYGSVKSFRLLFRWVQQADLTNPEDYAYFRSQIDVDNFIDYQIFELFAENTDWPANNMRCWQEVDGKWRWIFFDGDACLQWMTFYAFDNALDEGYAVWPSNWRATLFFRKLMENEDFKMRFNERFHELLNTAFSYEVTKPIFDDIKETINNEVPCQSERFGFPTNMDAWDEDMRRVDWFLRHRCEKIQEPLQVLFVGLPEAQQCQFMCYPNPFSGDLHVCFDADAGGATEISIYDLLGRKVFTQSCMLTQGYNDIMLQPNLCAGMYVLKVGCQTMKIVKQ